MTAREKQGEPTTASAKQLVEASICQVCGEALTGGRIVWCQDCGTPHHHDCWDFAGQCSTFACGCPRYRDHAPTTQRAASSMPALTITEDGQGWVGDRKVALPTPKRAPTWVPPVSGEGWLSVNGPYTRLDLDTPLEKTFQWLSVAALFIGFITGFPKHAPPRWDLVQTFFPAAFLLMLARMFVECTYVLDNGTRTLLYARTVLGITSTWRICDFAEIRRVGIRGERHEHKGSVWWTYAIILELPGGTRVQVSDSEKGFRRAVGTARCLAEHLGVPLAQAHPEQVGFAEETGGRALVPTESDGGWRFLPVVGRANWAWTFFFVFLAVLNYLIF